MQDVLDIESIKLEILKEAKKGRQKDKSFAPRSPSAKNICIYNSKESLFYVLRRRFRFLVSGIWARVRNNRFSGFVIRFLGSVLFIARTIEDIRYKQDILVRKLGSMQQDLLSAKRLNQKYVNLINNLHWRLQGYDQHRLISEKEEVDSLEDDLLSGYYLAFENAHRGSEEEIAKRMRVYLPFFDSLEINLKTFPIMDVGCGRGEWVGMLTEEQGWQALGLDLDLKMVQLCQEKGLMAFHEDATIYLESLVDNYLGAVTAFHVVEHMHPVSLIKMLKLAYEKIKPGGIIVLETPNPENLVVGSCNFHLDLTHLKPLPPISLQFMLSYVGFKRCETLRLNPMPELKSSDNDLTEDVLYRIYGPQDYALIGYKEK